MRRRQLTTLGRQFPFQVLLQESGGVLLGVQGRQHGLQCDGSLVVQEDVADAPADQHLPGDLPGGEQKRA
ncbi:MAG TPA: hypothetical protein VG013_19040 [Gemmataceae bacterium]|nr:hypothetical protein [Gemmataceae bacterium]